MAKENFYSQDRPVHFQTLNEEQITLIHNASLEVLQKTGVRFHHRQAVKLFQKAGADIEDGNLIKISPRLVEWALDRAPKEVTVFDQTGSPAMALGGYRNYFGVGSDCMHIYDLDTGQRRKATLRDVRTGVRLVDALPNLDFLMSLFLPSDVPEERYERHQMAVMLEESVKPIVYVGLEASSTVYAVDMAAAAAGGMDSLLDAPFIVNYVNTVSTLQHNEQSVERLLYAAERNLPTIYAPGNIRGMTAPITPAGQLALGNAGQLAGLVLSQLQREGSPFIRSNPSGGCMDMRSMVSLYAAPDCGPMGWDLAHHQELPIFGTAGCSDAKIFDAQAAAEAALSLFANILGGANLIHDIGYLDSAMTGSLELIVFCDELISWLKRYLRPPQINQETLALDLIHEIGPDGFFLESEHTYQHVREEWQPQVFDRKSFLQWAESGGTTLQERANHRVRKILTEHQAPTLEPEVKTKLQTVIEKD